MRAGSEDDAVILRVGLRQWVLSLERNELLTVLGWIQREVRACEERPNRRIVRVPDAEDRSSFSGDFIALASRVRYQIMRLPKAHLIVLEAWLNARVQGHAD